ncbi:MAG: hypothetical protein UZ12_BCD005000606 [Bacteroidetes bacterium OLB12]|nr:MAG: hypothetical protein UZ12_BCD005000606 [Bacteroidetes bacterium OLB12]
MLALAAVFYIGLILLYRALGLPSPEAIIAWTNGYYEAYGYWVVLAGALAEGALFINWYLPGSMVVALGAVFARQSGLNIFFNAAYGDNRFLRDRAFKLRAGAFLAGIMFL